MGIRMSEVPVEHLEKLFSNVVKQRGVEEATFCVLRDIPLSMAFDWKQSPEGQQFWDDIDEQRSISGSTSSSNTADLLTLTEEAERRGFAIGVRTEHGEIVKGYAHELLPNGDFFYSNIKVFKNGEWIKQIKTKQTTNDDMPELAAIHALFSDLINGLRRN